MAQCLPFWPASRDANSETGGAASPKSRPLMPLRSCVRITRSTNQRGANRESAFVTWPGARRRDVARRRRVERGARQRPNGVVDALSRRGPLERQSELDRVTVDRRPDVPGVHRRHRDLVAELETQRAGVGDDAVLAHRVGGSERQRDERHTRGDVDDAPATLAQRRERGAGHAPGPDEVHVDDGQGPLVRREPGALRCRKAGVVDQDVEPAELPDRLVDRGVDRRLVADVAADQTVPPGVDVETDHAGAAPLQLGHGRRADPAGRARDDDAPSAHATTGPARARRPRSTRHRPWRRPA